MHDSLFDIASSLYSYKQVGFISNCLIRTYLYNPQAINSVYETVDRDVRAIQDQLEILINDHHPVLTKTICRTHGQCFRASFRDKVVFIVTGEGEISYELRSRAKQSFIVFSYSPKLDRIYIQNASGTASNLISLVTSVRGSFQGSLLPRLRRIY